MTEKFPTEERYSQWQKKAVTTYIVNPRAPNASKRSIAGAIAQAKPYDRIELVGGEYYESFAITFPIEIVSAEGEDASISFRGPVLQCAQDVAAAYIADVQFHSKSKARNDASVVVSNGKPYFHRCQFNSVLVSGYGSPSFERCEINRSLGGVGIRFVDSSGGSVNNCKIHSHDLACVEIDTTGTLSVEDCTIFQPTKAMGILCQGVMSSSPQAASFDEALDAERENIARRAMMGGEEDPDDDGVNSFNQHLACGNVTIERNTIYQSQVVAATSTFAEGDSHKGNGTSMSSFGEVACVYVSHGARPKLIGNQFTEGEIGIIIELGGAPRLEMNMFRAQRVAGVYVLLTPDSLRHSAQTSDTDASAFHSGKTAKVEKNNLFERCRVGIDVHCCSGHDILHAENDPKADLMSKGTKNNAAQHRRSSVAGRRGSDAHGMPNKKVPPCLMPVEERDWLGLGVSDASSAPTTLQRKITDKIDAVMKDVLLTFPKCGKNEAIVHAAGQEFVLGNAAQLSSLTSGDSLGFKAFGMNRRQENVAQPSAENAMSAAQQAAMGYSKESEETPQERQRQEKLAFKAKCRISKLRGPGVTINGSRFLNCSVVGIRFTDTSRGLVQDCSFEGCGGCGVMVDKGSSPMVLSSVFDKNGECGLLVRRGASPFIMANEFVNHSNEGLKVNDFARGIITGNYVARNSGAGVEVSESGSPYLYANEFKENRRGGVCCVEGAAPYITCNKLIANMVHQVSVEQFACPTITKNDIIGGLEAGVHFAACGIGYLEENNIIENKGCGVELESDADPYIAGNIIEKNKQTGILSHNDSCGTFVENTIRQNELGGILVSQGSDPTVRFNTISGNLGGGICVAEEGCGMIEKNTFCDNSIANIVIRGDYSAPEVVKNIISKSASGPGLLCENNCEGIVRDNVFKENSSCGMLLRKGANPKVYSNRVIRELVGIVVESKAIGQFSKNEVAHNFGAGLVVQEGGKPSFCENDVFQNKDAGVVISHNAAGDVANNKILGNVVGVRSGSVTTTTFEDPNTDTMLNSTMELAEGSASLMRTPRPSGVSDSTTSSPSKRRGKQGVTPRKDGKYGPKGGSSNLGSSTLLLQNDIRDNRQCGVLLESNANGRFERNTITENGCYGVIADVDFVSTASDATAGSAMTTIQKGQNPRKLMQQQQRTIAATVGGGNCHFLQNDIHKHSKVNIAFHNHPGDNRIKFEDNSIYTAPIGVLMQRNSVVHTMTANKIHHVIEGIRCESSSRGSFSKNLITRCRNVGVLLTTSAHPTFEDGNIITFNGLCGVLVEEGGSGRVNGNIIKQNRFCGVCIVSATPTGSGAAFGSGAIDVGSNRHYSRTIFHENEISENEGHGVVVLSSVNAVARGEDNRRHSSSDENQSNDPTRVVEGSEFAQLVSNKIYKNRFCGVCVDEFTPDEYSIVAHDDDELNETVGSSNSVGSPLGGRHHNPDDLTSSWSPTASAKKSKGATKLRGNDAVHTSHEFPTHGGGIRSSSDSKGFLGQVGASATGFASAYSFSPDKKIADGSSPSPGTSALTASAKRLGITGSGVSPNGKQEAEDAVVLAQFKSLHRDRALTHVTVAGNDIHTNSIGLLVGSHCAPYIAANKIHRNNFFGLFFRASSAALVCGNRILENRVGGIYCCRFGRPKVMNNVVSSNDVLLEKAATSSLQSSAQNTPAQQGLMTSPQQKFMGGRETPADPLATDLVAKETFFAKEKTPEDEDQDGDDIDDRRNGGADSPLGPTPPSRPLGVPNSRSPRLQAMIPTIELPSFTQLHAPHSSEESSERLRLGRQAIRRLSLNALEGSLHTATAYSTSAGTAAMASLRRPHNTALLGLLDVVVPSSTHGGKLMTNLLTPRSHVRAVSSSTSGESQRMHDVGCLDYTHGGIGIWCEDGSEIDCIANEIRNHSSCGVLFSRGLLHHSAAAVHAKQHDQGEELQAHGRNGALFLPYGLCKSSEQRRGGGLSSVRSSYGSTPLHSMGNQHATASTSAAGGFPTVRGNKIHKNAKDGVLVQVHHHVHLSVSVVKKEPIVAVKESSSGSFSKQESTSSSSFQRSGSFTRTPSQSKLKSGANTAGSKSSFNAKPDDQQPATAKKRQGRTATVTVQSPRKKPGSGARSASPPASSTNTTTVPDLLSPSSATAVSRDFLFKQELDALTYAAELHDNLICDNSHHGVSVQQVNMIHADAYSKMQKFLDDCGERDPSLGALKPNPQLTSEEKEVFTLQNFKQAQLKNVRLSGNDMKGNGLSQVDASSAFVAVVEELTVNTSLTDSRNNLGSSTGPPSSDPLNSTMSPKAHLARSPFKSKQQDDQHPLSSGPSTPHTLTSCELVRVGRVVQLGSFPYATLLLERNRFYASRRGVWLHNGHRGTVLTHNQFLDLNEVGLVVEGCNAGVSVSEGNEFCGNKIGMHIIGSNERSHGPPVPRILSDEFGALNTSEDLTSGSAFSPTSSVAAMWSSRGAQSTAPIRIFKSRFTSNKEFGVLVEGDGGAMILRNTVSMHAAGSIALAVMGSKAVVHCSANDIKDNALGLLVARGSRLSVVEKNRIAMNMIGCRVRGGSGGVFNGNFFTENVVCGADIAGVMTAPSFTDNIFTGHRKDLARCEVEASATLQSGVSSTTSSKMSSPFISTFGAAATGGDVDKLGLLGPWLCDYENEGPKAICLSNEAGGLVERNLFYDNGISMLVCCTHPLLFKELPAELQQLQDSNTNALPAVLQSSSSVMYSPASMQGLSGSGNFASDSAPLRMNPFIFTNNVVKESSVAGCIVRGFPTSFVSQKVTPKSEPNNNDLLFPHQKLFSLVDPLPTERSDWDTLAEGRQSGVKIEHNLFESNPTCDLKLERGGDAFISNNMLLGSVVSSDCGRGVVASNYFLGSMDDSAVTIANGGQSMFINNTIRNASIGILAASGSAAYMAYNLISSVMIGIDTEGFCGTHFIGNTIMDTSDCGLRACGGLFHGNEVLNSPVGCIINAATATATTTTKKATEKKKRLAQLSGLPQFENGMPAVLTLEGSEVHSCDTDGILVAGGGKLIKNTVHNCRTNINVVATTEMPTFVENTIMDGETGVLFTGFCKANFSKNEVFDNIRIGVLVEADAQVVLDGNAISSSQDQGAIDVSPTAKAQLHHNSIRNQFSPAYKKGLTGQRGGMRKRRLDDIFAQMGNFDAEIAVLSRQMRQHLSLLDDRQENISSLVGVHCVDTTSQGGAFGSISSSGGSSLFDGNKRSLSTHQGLSSPDPAGGGGRLTRSKSLGTIAVGTVASLKAMSQNRAKGKKSDSAKTAKAKQVKAVQEATAVSPGVTPQKKRGSVVAGMDHSPSAGLGGNRDRSGSDSDLKRKLPKPQSIVIYVATPNCSGAEELAARLQQDLSNAVKKILQLTPGATPPTIVLASPSDAIVSILKASNCDVVLPIFGTNALTDVAGAQLNALHKTVFAKNNAIIGKTTPITCFALATEGVDLSNVSMQSPPRRASTRRSSITSTNTTSTGQPDTSLPALGGQPSAGAKDARKTGSMAVTMSTSAFFRVYGVVSLNVAAHSVDDLELDSDMRGKKEATLKTMSDICTWLSGSWSASGLGIRAATSNDNDGLLSHTDGPVPRDIDELRRRLQVQEEFGNSHVSSVGSGQPLAVGLKAAPVAHKPSARVPSPTQDHGATRSTSPPFTNPTPATSKRRDSSAGPASKLKRKSSSKKLTGGGK